MTRRTSAARRPPQRDTEGDGIEDVKGLATWGSSWNADDDGNELINVLAPGFDGDSMPFFIPSSGTVERLPFEVGLVNNVVPQTDQRVSFHQSFKTPPAFIAGIETTNGPETASARCRNLDVYQADVQIATDQAQNSGSDQTAEVVGYIVFGAP